MAKKKKEAAEGGAKKERPERKKNWTEVYATVEDIKAFLADRVFLRHNVITGRVEYHALTRGLEIATDENGLMYFSAKESLFGGNVGGKVYLCTLNLETI